MKEPLKVGERVAAYIDGRRYVGNLKIANLDGTFEFVTAASPGFTYTVHPKQCRRLRNKGTRIWIDPNGSVGFSTTKRDGWIELRVKK